MGAETGTVEFYNADKGYGFCRIDGRSGPSAFLHVSNVRDQNDVGVSSVCVGARVTFDIRDSRKKPGSSTPGTSNFWRTQHEHSWWTTQHS